MQDRNPTLPAELSPQVQAGEPGTPEISSGLDALFPSTSRLMDLDDIVDMLDLSDLRRGFIRRRCLGQLTRLERKARSCQRRYYWLRGISIVGAVTVPALVGLQLGSSTARGVVQWLTFALGLAVAITAVLEGFFKFGERWRRYRRTAELLKAETWLYLQFAGAYARKQSHRQAYPRFAAEVEMILGNNVDDFLSHIAVDPKSEAASAEKPSD